MLAVLGILATVAGCGDSGLTEEQVRKIVQEEMLKKTDTPLTGVFKEGDKLINPFGDSFDLPINYSLEENQEKCFATITTLEVTKKKEADISNIGDYWHSDNFCYYKQYIYEVKIEGKVDKKFAGKAIIVNLRVKNDNEFFGASGGYATRTTLSADGSFQITYLAYCATNENIIIPHSVAII